jgi:hypothetical protein
MYVNFCNSQQVIYKKKSENKFSPFSLSALFGKKTLILTENSHFKVADRKVSTLYLLPYRYIVQSF